MSTPSTQPQLTRHFGLVQATALNVTMIVGSGVFITVPLILRQLPGAYALLGWTAAALVMICDGLIWGELGAALPGSGGSYIYLLECYGRSTWGRVMAFLFIWQFLLSGPLEVGSGLIAFAQFSTGLSPALADFDKAYTSTWHLWRGQEVVIDISMGPTRVLALATGGLIIYLLRRRIEGLGRFTVTIWIGVLLVMVWILLEGAPRFDATRAFGPVDTGKHQPDDLWRNLGGGMRLAMYSYLGYYSVCYIGDEIRDPGRTIPRSILLSAVLVAVLFVGLHLAMVGVVDWRTIPTSTEALNDYSLPAEFMRRIYGEHAVAVSLVSLCLMWTCFGSVFAGILGYSRIPYGAARYGHFFAPLAHVHPTLAIPSVSLWLVGGLTLFWSLFDLGTVIDALVTTRIIEQFIAQVFGVVLLRKLQPDRPRPFRIWLYPLPCLLALVGWIFMYATAPWLFIELGLATLGAGAIAFLIWSWKTKGWPFGDARSSAAGSGGALV